MTIWIGDKSYMEEELLAMLKEDVSMLSRVIEQLEGEREAKLRAVSVVRALSLPKHIVV